MEGRLVIFLACVAITLIVNTVIIYAVFRIFGTVASKVTDGLHEIQTGSEIRRWLATMQTASENAVRVTGKVKEEIAGFEPVLAKMHVEHSERLAKADVRFKIAFRAIHSTATVVDGVVTWPIRHLRTASSIFAGVFAFIRGKESDADATSRRSR
jgi:hypothetical protein